jgi:hypothetical protein
MAATANPFRSSRGWHMLDQQNHAAGGASSSIMVGMFMCLCLASKKPSHQEFIVRAGTDLAVKLLMGFGGFLTRFDLICTLVLPYLQAYWLATLGY